MLDPLGMTLESATANLAHNTSIKFSCKLGLKFGDICKHEPMFAFLFPRLEHGC